MSRKQEQAAELGRRELAKQMRREQERARRLRVVAIWGTALVLVLALIGGVTAIVIANQPTQADLSAVRIFTFKTRDHVTGTVDYAQIPPAGGNHDGTWLTCGTYDAPVRSENAVHDLEHGAVWVTYRPDLPTEQVAVLQKLARSQTYVTLSPFPGLPAPVVATSWGKQLQLTGVGDTRLPAFIAKSSRARTSRSPARPAPAVPVRPAGDRHARSHHFDASSGTGIPRADVRRV